eukprot:GHVQ01004571.1.p1 GENE.GHVQ01004571.1~~GHVQ01004571.1.p1  ORF type:complete len:833 (+),score=93.37 GHVQ01004571.1:597-3095(+)
MDDSRFRTLPTGGLLVVAEATEAWYPSDAKSAVLLEPPGSWIIRVAATVLLLLIGGLVWYLWQAEKIGGRLWVARRKQGRSRRDRPSNNLPVEQVVKTKASQERDDEELIRAFKAPAKSKKRKSKKANRNTTIPPVSAPSESFPLSASNGSSPTSSVTKRNLDSSLSPGSALAERVGTLGTPCSLDPSVMSRGLATLEDEEQPINQGAKKEEGPERPGIIGEEPRELSEERSFLPTKDSQCVYGNGEYFETSDNSSAPLSQPTDSCMASTFERETNCLQQLAPSCIPYYPQQLSYSYPLLSPQQHTGLQSELFLTRPPFPIAPSNSNSLLSPSSPQVFDSHIIFNDRVVGSCAACDQAVNSGHNLSSSMNGSAVDTPASHLHPQPSVSSTAPPYTSPGPGGFGMPVMSPHFDKFHCGCPCNVHLYPTSYNPVSSTPHPLPLQQTHTYVGLCPSSDNLWISEVPVAATSMNSQGQAPLEYPCIKDSQLTTDFEQGRPSSVSEICSSAVPSDSSVASPVPSANMFPSTVTACTQPYKSGDCSVSPPVPSYLESAVPIPGDSSTATFERMMSSSRDSPVSIGKSILASLYCNRKQKESGSELPSVNSVTTICSDQPSNRSCDTGSQGPPSRTIASLLGISPSKLPGSPRRPPQPVPPKCYYSTNPRQNGEYPSEPSYRSHEFCPPTINSPPLLSRAPMLHLPLSQRSQRFHAPNSASCSRRGPIWREKGVCEPQQRNPPRQPARPRAEPVSILHMVQAELFRGGKPNGGDIRKVTAHSDHGPQYITQRRGSSYWRRLPPGNAATRTGKLEAADKRPCADVRCKAGQSPRWADMKD